MPDAVVVSDGKGVMQFVNRMTETLFGYDRTELVGEKAELLIPSRFRAGHRSHREELFEAARVRPMGVRLQLTGLRKDGTEIPIEISLAPFTANQETYAVAAISDVTERKLLEEQARQLLKAQEEIRERDQVLTIASHELQAPVAAPGGGIPAHSLRAAHSLTRGIRAHTFPRTMARRTRRQILQDAALAGAALFARPLLASEPVDAAAIRKLASAISGQVITPDAPDYPTARLVFNRAFDQRPALIVRCAGASDIARALDFARAQRLPLAIRGGGHSRAGFSVCEGGLVMDLSALNKVEVDAGKRVARAGAGALVRDMDRATQRHGLATTMGGCPTVGVAGLTLGGGEGLLMSKYGAACDNLVSAQLIAVDGRKVEASAATNPDLFWAIRGGGGNFAVVTELEYRLYPLERVLAGTMTYAPGQAAELLHSFTQFVAAAPDEMNLVGQVLPTAQGPRFHLMVCHCGDARQGNDLLKPLRARKPEQDTVRVAPYLEIQETINPYAPAAHFQTNVFLPQLGADAIATIVVAAGDAPLTTRVFIVPLYGAISRVGVTDTAFPLRQPGYEVDIMGRWSDPGEKDKAVRWVRALRDKLTPLSCGVYSNQLGETSDELARAAYGANYTRLSAIKKTYDPDNVLRKNQNIKPR